MSETIEARVIAAGDVGGTTDDWHDVALKDLGEQRQHLVTQAIATMVGGGVGGVFAKVDAVRQDELIDFAAAYMEQGTELDEAVVRGGTEAHAAESGESGAAEEIPEDGLGLIVGVMREEDKRRAMLQRHATEKVISRAPAGEFDGDVLSFRGACDVSLRGLTFHAQLFGKPGDEEGIVTRVPAA